MSTTTPHDPRSTAAPHGHIADAARDLEGYASRYAALPFERIQVEYRRQLVLDVLQRLRPRRVVEVGCGEESLALYAGHTTGYDRWIIVEPAERFAEQAQARLRDDPRVTVVVATIEDAVRAGTLATASHDLVLLSSLLHEVPDPGLVLRGARALCHPGGHIHVNVPNATSFHRELAVAMGIVPSVETPSAQQVALQQRRIFDASSLHALVGRSGLRVEEGGGYFVKPFTHAQMQALVTLGTIDRSVLDGLYRLGKKFPGMASEIWVNARPA